MKKCKKLAKGKKCDAPKVYHTKKASYEKSLVVWWKDAKRAEEDHKHYLIFEDKWID
jgi:hypothetical protein